MGYSSRTIRAFFVAVQREQAVLGNHSRQPLRLPQGAAFASFRQKELLRGA